MTDPASIFLLIGSFSIAMNTWQDLKTGKIDSKKNLVMTGLTTGYYFFTGADILMYFAMVIVVLVFNYFMNKGKEGKLFGEGDQEAFYWIVPGLFLVDPLAPFIFGWALFFFMGINFGLRRLKKIPNGVKTPAFMALLGAFLLTAGLYFLSQI